MDFTGERYIPGIGGNIALEHEHRYRFCLELVRGRKVLDIACGEGYGSDLLATVAQSVHGVDIDEQTVHHAANRYKRANLVFSVGSCTSIPLPDRSVDVVVSFETIEHHDKHEEMMSEIRRVLVPGGALIISSPDKRVYSDQRNFKNQFHVKELYADEFSRLLKSHFQNVEMFGQRIVYGSALVLQEGAGQIRSYGVGQKEPVSGIFDPVYQVAVASDDPSWIGLGSGGLLEESVHQSEEVMERVAALQRGGGAQEELDELWRSWYASNLIRKAAFHRSGTPRSWLQTLLLKDRRGTPRSLSRRVLFNKKGDVRPSFRRWYDRVLDKKSAYANLLLKFQHGKAVDAIRTLHVVTTPHTQFIGESIAQSLTGTRFQVTSATTMPPVFDHDLYIIVAPQMFPVLPPPDKRIMFQMEQIKASKWLNRAYLDMLSESLAILDYSTHNISALAERGINTAQLYYVPILPMDRKTQRVSTRDIDVLFYGATNCPRRQTYIDALQKRVNLRVETDTFGQDIREILNRTKVVVNIHFYENALLETTRLSEALSHGAHVVSESGVDQEDRADFEASVEFVPCGVVEAFVQKVEAALSAWQRPFEVPEKDDFAGTTYHILRALNGIGVLSLEEMQNACREFRLPSGRLILTLPEHVSRYKFAREHALTDAVAFHGLRNIDGWKGCASSYKFIAMHGLHEGAFPLTVYEDDAIFPYGAEDRLAIIEKELKTFDTEWDIFSGLLTDLDADASISRIETVDTEEFITLDSVIGMVFSVYNRSGLEMLAKFEFSGTDVTRHTIDRYLEAQRPRTITVWPPLTGHAEFLDSTLWAGKNVAFTPMIDRSIERLGSKRIQFHLAAQEKPQASGAP